MLKCSKPLFFVFLDASGKERKIRIDDPKDDLMASEVKDAMDIIIDRNICRTGPGERRKGGTGNRRDHGNRDQVV